MKKENKLVILRQQYDDLSLISLHPHSRSLIFYVSLSLSLSLRLIFSLSQRRRRSSRSTSRGTCLRKSMAFASFGRQTKTYVARSESKTNEAESHGCFIVPFIVRFHESGPRVHFRFCMHLLILSSASFFFLLLFPPSHLPYASPSPHLPHPSPSPAPLLLLLTILSLASTSDL